MVPDDASQEQAAGQEEDKLDTRHTNRSSTPLQVTYPAILPPPPTSTFFHPPPLAARLFPHPKDSRLTSSNKLVSLTTGLAFTLASARGALAAVLTHRGGRRLAFRQGFTTTFPIYLTAFLLGAFADHALSRTRDGEGGRRRSYEYDLP